MSSTSSSRPTAIITGGAGGIGQAISRRLAADNFQVVIHYQQGVDAATQLAAALVEQGHTAIAVGADLATASGCETLISEARNAFGTVSTLVNNAAIQPVALLADITPAGFQEMMATNVQGPFRLMQLMAQGLVEAQYSSGRIVNIASIEGRRPANGHSHYATSKAALIMATQAAALELGPQGITVNAVSPGLIHREGIEEAWPEGVASWNENTPLGRLGTPENVAEAVSFLVSDKAAWITGHNLVVDGGMSVIPGW